MDAQQVLSVLFFLFLVVLLFVQGAGIGEQAIHAPVVLRTLLRIQGMPIDRDHPADHAFFCLDHQLGRYALGLLLGAAPHEVLAVAVGMQLVIDRGTNVFPRIALVGSLCADSGQR